MWRHTSALPLALVVFDVSGGIVDCNDRLLKTAGRIRRTRAFRGLASIGIVHHRDHTDLERLIQAADAALYPAKAKGRGKWWMAPVG